jgi:hypothetical protein
MQAGRLMVLAAMACLVLFGSVSCRGGATVARPEILRPGEEADDGIQGLYTTLWQYGKGSTDMTALVEGRVIGEGGGRYRLDLFLPDTNRQVELTGRLQGNNVVFSGRSAASDWAATLDPKRISNALELPTLQIEEKVAMGVKLTLKRTFTKSPTEGLMPLSALAIFLLPYTPDTKPLLEAWANKSWEALADGSMVKGGGDNRTKKSFGDMKLHLEFRCPYRPNARGQDRGNSGVYLMDRYEVQILDSFGLAPKPNECGAVYTVAAPKTMASFPPGAWQTYDITFRAPRFGANGTKTADAVVTVVHNGVTIIDNVKVPGPTGGAASMEEVKEAPIRLQDHGSPVRFRNIWVEPLVDAK